MLFRRNNHTLATFSPRYEDKRILIAIDSSKSNSAIIVGDIYGNIIDDYEISGEGSSVDVYDLCWHTREFLKVIFKGALIEAVGIEDIITKREHTEGNKYGYSHSTGGLDIHQSRAKITAVFNNFIFFFQDYHNKMPLLINNKEWKAAVLPSEFRKMTHKKGSKDYYDSLGGRWSGRKDDVTDAVCIFQYLYKLIDVEKEYVYDAPQAATGKFQYAFYREDEFVRSDIKVFKYNPNFTLEQNVNTISSMLEVGEKIGVSYIPIEYIPLEVIYSDKFDGVFPRDVEKVLCIIMNE